MPTSENGASTLRSRGRPRSDLKLQRTRFTEETLETFAEAYAASGGHFQNACKAMNVSRETVYSYLRKDPSRLEELKRKVEAPTLFRITELGNQQKDWRPFAWFLERVFPEKYALTSVTRFEHSGNVEHTVKMVTMGDLQNDVARIREIQAQVLG